MSTVPLVAADEGIESQRHDPYNLTFNKQFPETDEDYESVRTIQKTCYHYTRKGCFNFWSLVVGIILAFVWGIVMGTTQFVIQWVVNPSVVCQDNIYYMLT